MNLLNLGFVYFFLILNVTNAIIKPHFLGPFFPDFWIPFLLLICVKFEYLKGLFLSLTISYLISLYSIIPSPVYLMVGLICFVICKTIFEFSTWKNIAILTMLTAGLSILSDLLLLITSYVAESLTFNWKIVLLSLPSRALLNSLVVYLTIAKFFPHQLQEDPNP